MSKAKAMPAMVFVLLSSISLWSAAKPVVLTEANGAASDRFGTSVSMSASTIVVGAPHATPPGGTVQGAAFVFVKTAKGWPTTPTAILSEPPQTSDDYFGTSVAISPDGKTIVSSAPGKTIGSNVEQGAVFVFTQPAGGWVNSTSYAAELYYAAGLSSDQLGESVAINNSANTIIAGAPQDESFGKGLAFVFQEPTGGWVTTGVADAELFGSTDADGSGFGTSVAIMGNGLNDTAVVGAPHASTLNSCSDCGVVFLYEEPSNGVWGNNSENAQLYPSELFPNSELGAAVAISNVTVSGKSRGVVAAGASNAIINGNNSQGTVFVFVESASGWVSSTQTGQITPADGAQLDFFGASVAVNGAGASAYVMAGAPDKNVGTNDFQGEAYIFSFNPTTGASSQLYELSQGSTGAENDNFGWSVALTLTSPSTAVVGAPGNSVNGNAHEGEAVVYQQ